MAVIRRADWNAGAHRSPRITTPVGRLFLHHTATPEWTGVDAARRLHQVALDRGFLEISYSWLIDVAGNQIEGRGWGYQGAHTVGFNSTAHGISLIGNFETTRVPERMLQALAGLVRRHGAQRWGPGRITNVHRDVAPTSCPGRNAIAIVGRVNRIAAGGGGGGDGEMLEGRQGQVRPQDAAVAGNLRHGAGDRR